jgi:pyruvate/2-oxoglutarate/acetoin dehydrogenase E1 component
MFMIGVASTAWSQAQSDAAAANKADKASAYYHYAHVTIVTWGATVYLATELARQMKAEGRSLEIIDLRTLVPLDEELIYRSIRKTSGQSSCTKTV